MKIAILCFTRRGRELEQALAKRLKISGHDVQESVKCQELAESMTMSAKAWTKEMFEKQDVLIFIGALQIAVRLTAPCLKSKLTDPAVLVLDEMGQYCIPMLSGHIGGANEIAAKIADELGALPVITTATDIHQKWAVDVFARKNHLYIEDMQMAKKISAAVLEGRRIRVAVEGGADHIEGKIPEEIDVVGETETDRDVYIGIHEQGSEKSILRLVPRVVTLGIGCKKGTTREQIQSCVEEVLQREAINADSITKIASIDLKKEEKGLLEFCKTYRISLEVYTAEELREIPGEFSPSVFVQKVTGVDNVCERSAVRAGGTLRVKKQAKNGVTVALAWNSWRVRFE